MSYFVRPSSCITHIPLCYHTILFTFGKVCLSSSSWILTCFFCFVFFTSNVNSNPTVQTGGDGFERCNMQSKKDGLKNAIELLYEKCNQIKKSFFRLCCFWPLFLKFVTLWVPKPYEYLLNTKSLLHYLNFNMIHFIVVFRRQCSLNEIKMYKKNEREQQTKKRFLLTEPHLFFHQKLHFNSYQASSALRYMHISHLVSWWILGAAKCVRDEICCRHFYRYVSKNQSSWWVHHHSSPNNRFIHFLVTFLIWLWAIEAIFESSTLI